MLTQNELSECLLRFNRDHDITGKMRILENEIGYPADRLVVHPDLFHDYFPGIDSGHIYGLVIVVDPDCPRDTVVICAREPE